MPFDLVTLRKSSNLTQAEVADRLGIPRHRVGRLERGIGNLKTLAVAVNALGGTLPCLRTIRLRTGISARTLASRIGTTHSVISVMEHEGRGSVGTWLAALDVLAHDIAGVELHCGDAAQVLKHIEPKSIATIVCSPPYWSQKTYAGGPGLGNEPAVDAYLDNLANIFAACKQALRDDGSCFVVIADTFQNKALQQVPARLAQRMSADGWFLRQEIVWSKQGQGLSSAPDRARNTHEFVQHYAKRRSYHFNGAAWRVPYSDGQRLPDADQHRRRIREAPNLTDQEKTNALAELERRVLEGRDYRVRLRGQKAAHRNGVRPGARDRAFEKVGFFFHDYHPDGSMVSSVWEIASTTDDVHPAPFPEELARRCIEATSEPGDLILDPFAGSGTVAVVARRLGRRAIAIDIAPEYIQRTRARLLSE